MQLLVLQQMAAQGLKHFSGAGFVFWGQESCSSSVKLFLHCEVCLRLGCDDVPEAPTPEQLAPQPLLLATRRNGVVGTDFW